MQPFAPTVGLLCLVMVSEDVSFQAVTIEPAAPTAVPRHLR